MDWFLTVAYTQFDLAVWSQTSWRWLEVKLTELGMLENPGYRIAFALDKTSMFSIISTKVRGCVGAWVRGCVGAWVAHGLGPTSRAPRCH